jgi:thiamine phosphate synthase YjbQ (UPF0047 family)
VANPWFICGTRRHRWRSVRIDLVTALRRLAPADAGWVHEIEGPDDMPAHVKSMLNG